jgi:fatty-acid desaturase
MNNVKAGKPNNFMYYVFYPSHLLAWIGLLFYHVFFDFSWINLVYLIVGWILIEGVGVAVTLHRYLSHRAFVAKSWARPIMLWLACMSLQGSPIWWVAVHRGSHHRHSDTEQDAHSPVKGKWYAWHGWLYEWDKYFNPKFATDLIRDPLNMWIAKHYTFIVVISYIVIGLISWKLLLFGLIIPAAISVNQESGINVLCHSGSLGYRNFNTSDNSRNVPLLAWLTWGQGWHNNHHERASSYDFGTTVSGNGKEFDVSLLLLPFVSTKESRQKIWRERNDKLHAQ